MSVSILKTKGVNSSFLQNSQELLAIFIQFVFADAFDL